MHITIYLDRYKDRNAFFLLFLCVVSWDIKCRSIHKVPKVHVLEM